MTTEKVKRKLTAILSADVKGYSRLMGADEVGTIRILQTYRGVISDLIQKKGGRVVDSPGDNVLAEFASVVDALESAVEIQRELKVRNADRSESRRMEFRIGINLGDVVEEGERIYGDGVNIAARIEGLAEGGEICISGTAFDQIGKRLPLGYEYMGEQEVKNIEKPVRVYRVLMEPEQAGRVIGEKAPKRTQWRWAVAAAIVLVCGAFALWNFYLRPPPMEPASKEKMAFPLPDKPSIAVLPFVNMSDDKEQEYFSDGLTEEIITALSKSSQLFVIASNTSFTYKGKPVKIKQVSLELGVRYVVEGSVRKAGNRMRITAQLIDAGAERHLWGDRYDRELKDLFAVQDDITKNIITAVHVTLTDGERARIVSKRTSNLDAYLKTVEAQWSINQSTKDGVLRGAKLAEEAIGVDPSYVDAYIALGTAHLYMVWWGMSQSPGDSLKRSIDLFQKAVTLDESAGDAHANLGYALVVARQYDKAVAECEKAMALEPNSYTICYICASTLTFAGRRDEAIAVFREALRINPKPPTSCYRHFAIALRDSGQYDEAIALSNKAVEREPNDLLAYIVLASSLEMAGREEEARSAAKEVLRINPGFSLERLAKTSPHKDRAVVQRFIEALHKVGLK
jgi:adenylate cyclase